MKNNRLAIMGIAFVLTMLTLNIYIDGGFNAESKEKKQSEQKVVFDCEKDISTPTINQQYVDCLKKDFEQMFVILDDKVIDQKEAALLQKVTLKINDEYKAYMVVNTLNNGDRDFMKQLERFDDKGYTEVINTKYKASLHLFFKEWINAEQEYINN